jgi:hypothetical protein
MQDRPNKWGWVCGGKDGKGQGKGGKGGKRRREKGKTGRGEEEGTEGTASEEGGEGNSGNDGSSKDAISTITFHLNFREYLRQYGPESAVPGSDKSSDKRSDDTSEDGFMWSLGFMRSWSPDMGSFRVNTSCTSAKGVIEHAVAELDGMWEHKKSVYFEQELLHTKSRPDSCTIHVVSRERQSNRTGTKVKLLAIAATRCGAACRQQSTSQGAKEKEETGRVAARKGAG